MISDSLPVATVNQRHEIGEFCQFFLDFHVRIDRGVSPSFRSQLGDSRFDPVFVLRLYPMLDCHHAPPPRAFRKGEY